MFEPLDPTLKTMDELVKFLFYKLKEINEPITETTMQKLIFKIKKDLGNNHELNEKLPYYWYYHGPFSEVVKDSFRDITNEFCEKHCYKKFILKNQQDDFNNVDLINNFTEIEKITDSIINNDNIFPNLIEYVYETYAPYKIFVPFRFKIYKTADKCRSSHYFDVDNYIDTFYNCESLLPNDDYFFEFSDIYSQFCTNLDLINDKGNFENYWNFLRNIITELWETFAKGIRVNFKDNYYNSNNDKWNQHYNNALNILVKSVDKTENITNDKYIITNYTSSQKKILNTTIGNYLRG